MKLELNHFLWVTFADLAGEKKPCMRNDFQSVAMVFMEFNSICLFYPRTNKTINTCLQNANELTYTPYKAMCTL